MLTYLSVATLRLIFAIELSSKLPFLKLAPSKLAISPEGSSKVHLQNSFKNKLDSFLFFRIMQIKKYLGLGIIAKHGLSYPRIETFSMTAQTMRAPQNVAPSAIAPDKSHLSMLQCDMLAPFKLQPCMLAYL